jgi:hypothetical protein
VAVGRQMVNPRVIYCYCSFVLVEFHVLVLFVCVGGEDLNGGEAEAQVVLST